MTRFAEPVVIQCPNCSKHVKLRKIASINFSPGLFPDSFKALLRGEVTCPCCDAEIQANELPVIEEVSNRWQKWKWRNAPFLEPRV